MSNRFLPYDRIYGFPFLGKIPEQFKSSVTLTQETILMDAIETTENIDCRRWHSSLRQSETPSYICP